MNPAIHVIIPACNEASGIEQVLSDIPDIATEIVVVDNASTDNTAALAKERGATVLYEPVPGYGNACLRGIAYCKGLPHPPDIVVFLDGDYSDYPEEMDKLVRPILRNEADLVIGSRASGKRDKGSMTFPQIFGNWLATRLMAAFFGAKFTDLGPFRAIRFSSLRALDMRDRTYGWTVEMQIKATKQKLRCLEVPVSYRKRIGKSKISGTVKGTIMAGYKILYTVFRYL